MWRLQHVNGDSHTLSGGYGIFGLISRRLVLLVRIGPKNTKNKAPAGARNRYFYPLISLNGIESVCHQPRANAVEPGAQYLPISIVCGPGRASGKRNLVSGV